MMEVVGSSELSVSTRLHGATSQKTAISSTENYEVDWLVFDDTFSITRLIVDDKMITI
jgi:hypothetical protein